MSDEKRMLTQAEYQQLLGLGLLVVKTRDHLQELEDAMAGLVGVEREKGHRWAYNSHVSDSIYEADPVAYIMEKMDIEVEE